MQRGAFLQELQRRIETATDRLIAEAARQSEAAAIRTSTPTPRDPV
jgi:hypothetical protein